MTLRGLKKRIALFLTNHFLAGTRCFELKRKLLRFAGYEIGVRTKNVGPVFITGELTTGEDCWIGSGLKIHGNGRVVIGSRCDLGPDVSFMTGAHRIGSHAHRAGEGYNADIQVGDGCWICAGVSFMPGVQVGEGCVIASCACVTKNITNDCLAGGIPAKVIRMLDNAQ